MICYFPTPYQDELLYSIVSRYQSHVVSAGNGATMKELFNKQASNLGIESLSNLARLVDNLKPLNEKITIEYFLMYHTIIPFIIPFQEENWLKKIIVRSSKQRYNAPFGKLGHFLGKGNFIKEHLYYCKECLREQFDGLGEGYWNRIFQCPGVLVCIKHQKALTRYPVNIIKESNQPFLLLEKQDIYNEQLVFKEGIFPFLLNLAEDIQYLFDSKFESLSSKQLFNKYETLMAKKNIGFPKAERQKKLGKLMLDYYPKEFLKLLNSDFEIEDTSNWLKYFLGEKSMYHSYPIRHLLVIRCLCGSPKRFFEENFIFEPFGEGPWICMNTLADHYLKRCIEDVEITLHGLNRRLQGDFKCSCGFIYRLREWEQNPLSVTYFSNRIIERGEVWEEKFESLMRDGATVKELCTYTGFSKPTIQKIKREKRKRQKNYSEDKNLIEEQQKEKTEEYKIKWKVLRESFPDYNRRELNNMNRAIYAWLRKYDPKWIEDNSPPSKRGQKLKIKEVDAYHRRDQQLLVEAKKIVEDWEKYEKSKGKLIRKSLGKLDKILAPMNKIQNKEKYPLTEKYISEIVETIEDFQKRRIRHILQTSFQNQKVTSAKMRKLASIHKKGKANFLEVNEYLEEVVKAHNQNVIL